jgi:hypothetical protein
MDDGQTKVAQAGVRSAAFAEDLVTSKFTHTPMTAVDTKYAETIVKLNGAITELGGKEAIQAGRGFNEKSAEKRVSRHDLDDLVKRTNRTAGSIADATGNSSMMNSFRMPYGSGDEELKTKAKAMGQAVTDLGLGAAFEAEGLPDHANALNNAADAFQANEGQQGTALSAQTGATAVIRVHLKTIKSAMKTLDSIYHNVLGDAETLGGWESVSHVEKVASRKKDGAAKKSGGVAPGGNPV